MITNNQTEEQREAFKTAMVTGKLKELVAARGGTGDSRKELSSKEKAKRKNRRKAVKMSRKANR
jgi:hypothetical protein